MEFIEFVKKYNSESSRIHSEMGSRTSELKKKTSAENGKKGGRPKKSKLALKISPQTLIEAF
jgi:hypothetical protein